MNKSNRRISDIFYNNRFLLVFSIIAAIAIWLVVAVEFGEEIENTLKIKNVKAEPVGVDIVPFGDNNFEVSVVIKGKKYIVESSETLENLEVVLKPSQAVVAGKETVLNVEVRHKEARPLYEIVDFYPKTVSVFYDIEEYRDMEIETEIELETPRLTADGYYGDKTNVEFVNEFTVKVTGPRSEMSKLEKVVAKATLEGDFKETQIFTADLVLVSQNSVTLEYCKPNIKSVQLRLPIYKEAYLTPVVRSFMNTPADYINNLPLECTVSPRYVTVGLPEDQLEGKEDFELASKIDFLRLHEGVNTIPIPAKSSEVPGGILIDEGLTDFVVTVNVQGMSRKTVTASENITVNVPEDLNLELVGVNFDSVEVVGPSEELSHINGDNLVFTADFSSVEGSEKGKKITVPVKLFDKKCWLYRESDEYTATFIVN